MNKIDWGRNHKGKSKGDVTKLPYHGARAQFENGTKVALPSTTGGICFTGVVVGRGVDTFGEYQTVKILTPLDHSGEIRRCRLMDLAWLMPVC